MPLQTDLKAAPYYDDYREDKNFHKIVFRPGVAVQVRELNQLQTIFQKQVEMFGDHVFKRGTIVSGCNFQFFPSMAFVKLRDLDIDLKIIDVGSFQDAFVRNNANLTARVIKTVSGYESTDPDLNTLYVSYTNAGNTNNLTSFEAGDTLTVFDTNNSVFSVKINSGSLNFSNNDTVVFLAALGVQNTTGGVTLPTSFSVGETVTQSTTGAKANIVSIDTSSNTLEVILRLKPLSNNMANGVNTFAWSFQTGYTVTGGTSGASANVAEIIGSGATASVVTDGAGVITNVNMSEVGLGYYIEPYVSVASANNTGNVTSVNNLSLTGRNYINKITVAPNTFANPVNVGYGFSISNGVIYQKGFFVRVESQLAIVEKYSNVPHQVVIGFDTVEEIINSNSDSTLLDNIIDGKNENAPGANRLKLTPVLTVLDKNDATANDEFFNIVEFSEGAPYKQAKTTEYNLLADELAKRTYNESGNFVLDPFLVNTKSPALFADESSNFNVIIDPGLAYIKGYEVQTFFNQEITTNKAKSTAYIADNSVDIDYGSYIEVNQLAGFFQFNTGAVMSLRDTANTYLTTSPGLAITGPGSEIGTARMKSLVYINGEAGSPTAKYRMYLFDIRMNSGKNFRNVKAVLYDGTNKGVADVILSTDGTTGAQIAVLQEANKSRLLFPTKTTATKTLITNSTVGIHQGNVVFQYKTIANNLSVNTTGNCVISVSSPEWFPYAGSLSDNEKEDLVIVPLANAQASANAAGSIATTAAQSNVIGTATSFNSVFRAGDYIKVANATALEIRRITQITNATHMIVNGAFTNTFSTGNVILYFPQNVPISFASRSDRTASVTANTTLTINFGNAINVATTLSVSYIVKRRQMANTNVKVAKRKLYVKLRANNHSANVIGPWCLGIPDAFRLRNVYMAEDTNVNTNSTVVTSQFYVDHNQTEDYHGVGYLFKNPNSNLTLAANVVLLAELDAFTQSAAGLITIDSYPVNDSLTLAQADLNPTNSTIHTVELPEMYGYQTAYYDSRDILDFRPQSANTANLATTAATASTNPAEPSNSARFTATEKYFPVPQSDVFFDIEYYLPRIDRTVVDRFGEFRVVKGTPGEAVNPPPAPTDSITLDIVSVPQYPTLPAYMSGEQLLYNDRKIANELILNKRLKDYTIKSLKIGTQNLQQFEQPKRYTQADIGSLERRIADLEYWSELSQIEDDVKDKTITSSSDPAVNRFKFGFFVDNFTTTNFSNFDSPEYNATIFDNELAPRKQQINLLYRFYTEDEDTSKVCSGDIMGLPYDEITISEQLNATVPIPPPPPPDPDPVVNTPANDCVLYTSSKSLAVWSKVTNYNTSTNNSLLIAEVNEVSNVANTSHTITLYFDFHSGKDRIEVYQTTGNTGTLVTIGNKSFLSTTATPITTSESASNLSAAERNMLTANNVLNSGTTNNQQRTGPWTVANRPNFNFATRGINTSYWVQNAGKISWTHNPNLGSTYRIVDVKGSPVHGYYLTYDSDYILCGNTTPPPEPPYPHDYDGSCTDADDKIDCHKIDRDNDCVVPKIVNTACSSNSTSCHEDNITQCAKVKNQCRTFTFRGLKPNCKHRFLVNGNNVTNNCIQTGKRYGEGIETDEFGRCTVTWEWNVNESNTTSSSYINDQQRCAETLLIQCRDDNDDDDADIKTCTSRASVRVTSRLRDEDLDLPASFRYGARYGI